MPSYEIRYDDAQGERLEPFVVPCGGDKQERILAHAMRPRAARRIDVWAGDTLIYVRPDAGARPTIAATKHNAP